MTLAVAEALTPNKPNQPKPNVLMEKSVFRQTLIYGVVVEWSGGRGVMLGSLAPRGVGGGVGGGVYLYTYPLIV